MKSDAAGQLLGYSMQFPRALWRLLQVGSGGSVGIEVLGDVASFFPEGLTVTEEDKSSIGQNPLTDRSQNLWKTFYNWTVAVVDEEVDVNATRFVLYCNQSGKKALVDEFCSAESKEAAGVAIAKARQTLADITSEHEIWKFYNYVINQHTDVFLQIIQRFELIVGKDAGYENVRMEFKRQCIPDGSIDFVMNEVGGWVQKNINEKISKKESAIISFDEYSRHFTDLLLRVRQRALIDFASQQMPKDDEITGYVRIRPTYIRQLDLIRLPDAEIIEAVSDYLRADFNRNKWIEDEILDANTAEEFEKKLKSFWKNTKRKTEITNASLSEEDRGKLILYECCSRPETIRGESPPDRTIQGTYHALADKKDVGWHPCWEGLIEKGGGQNGSGRK